MFRMKILFIGDIVGKPGRKAVVALLPKLRQEYAIDVVVANVENLAHGKGITASTWQEMRTVGVDIGTGGNHTFSKPQAAELYSDQSQPLVRPFNLPPETAGQGSKVFTVSQKKVLVINLFGQHCMSFDPVDSPFQAMEALLKKGLPAADVSMVDIHAEATSEKVCLGWFLDGKVGLVMGTHTHVPTADLRILPGGTAYVTDVGMVGLRDSSLGVDKDAAIQRFLNGTKAPNEITDHGLVTFNSVLVEIRNGQAVAAQRIDREVEV